MKLSTLKEGQSAIIKSINCDNKTRQKLEILGVTDGAKITFIRSAPLFDPIELKIRGYYLAIRKNVADKIMVKCIK